MQPQILTLAYLLKIIGSLNSRLLVRWFKYIPYAYSVFDHALFYESQTNCFYFDFYNAPLQIVCQRWFSSHLGTEINFIRMKSGRCYNVDVPPIVDVRLDVLRRR